MSADKLAQALGDAVLLFSPLCRDCTALNWRERANAALAAHQAQQAEPTFLLEGARFKVSSAGASGYIGGLPSELNGRWVALVAADDDCHLKHAAPQQAQAPAGWQLVPVEPTPEMLAAVVTSLDEHLLGREAEQQYREDWSAMLAAAPQQGSKS